MPINDQMNSFIVRIVVSVLLSFCEVTVSILWKWTILESIGLVIISRQRVNLHLIHFRHHKILERSVLLARLAFIPVLHLGEAHAT